MTVSRSALRDRWWLPMAIAALVFLALLGGLLLDGRLAAADSGINAFFGRYRSEPLLTAFVWITGLGANPAIVAVVATATAFLWSARRRRAVAALWLTYLGAQATTLAIKLLVGRARPEFLELITASSPSFPSGHSTSAMAVYGFLAWLLVRSGSGPGPRPSVALLWGAAVLIALIGFSRLFLSLHYASDVLGGFLVGWFWLLVGVAVMRRETLPPLHVPLPPSAF